VRAANVRQGRGALRGPAIPALFAMALLAGGGAIAQHAARTPPVVAIKPDRIILMDLEQAGQRIIAVGERGFALLSDDGGQTWKAVPTPVTRTLTGLAFRDEKLGIAVGHGASLIRTEDAGETWSQVALDEAGSDSLLGVTHLDGERFLAYGAFGLLFETADAGQTWTRRTVISEEFDRHISQVLPVDGKLLLVAESGTLARSDDGGQTWTALTSPYEGSFFGALETRDGAVLVYGMRGNIWRTNDLGTTWHKVETGTTASLMSGRQLADGRVLFVGNTGLLALSRDGGQTVHVHWSPAGRGFAALLESGDEILTAGESGIARLDPAWLAEGTGAR
jgi:photosystem II stability/assembly factor-like uncharacterized protein